MSDQGHIVAVFEGRITLRVQVEGDPTAPTVKEVENVITSAIEGVLGLEAKVELVHTDK